MPQCDQPFARESSVLARSDAMRTGESAMRSSSLRRSLFKSSIVVVLLVMRRLRRRSGYNVISTRTRTDLGLFMAIPLSLARADRGNVTMSAFSITETLGSFEFLTVTLADLAGLSSAPYGSSSMAKSRQFPANSVRTRGRHRSERGHGPRE